jgi:tetratricopeptide (TPR) repeat protein
MEQRYWQEYYRTANSLYKLDTQHPHEARAIALRELPNMQRALDLALVAGEVELAISFVDRIAKFLNSFGRRRERDTLLKKIESLHFHSAEGLTKAEYLQLSGRGDALLQAGRARQAEALFRDLLARLEDGAAYDTAYDHALTLFRLGRCLEAQGRPSQAIEWHQSALERLKRLSTTHENAKAMCGSVYTDLGNNLAAVGQFDAAQRAYENSLGISHEVEDKRNVIVTLSRLAELALRRNNLAEADRLYTEALTNFQVLGEPQSEAIVWHQLGRVAEEGHDWDRAERCYRESLRLKELYGDIPGVARTCNQLANVAKNARRLDDAERWYLRSLEMFE